MGKEAAAGARSNEKERGEGRGRIEVEGARTRRKIDREKSRHSVVAAEQQPMLAWKDGFLACSLASRLPFFFLLLPWLGFACWLARVGGYWLGRPAS